MPRSVRRAVLLGVCLLLLACASAAERGVEKKPAPRGPAEAVENLKVGMTGDQVREQLGRPPHRTARQLLYHRYLEQWVYDQPFSVRLEFNCPRGQKPQLISIHKLASGNDGR